MSRAKVVIVLVLVVVAGFVVGWWLSGQVQAPPMSPVQKSAESSPAKRVSGGFCCMTVGQACVAVQRGGKNSWGLCVRLLGVHLTARRHLRVMHPRSPVPNRFSLPSSPDWLVGGKGI